LPLADIPDPATLLGELLGPATPEPQVTSSASITPFTRLVGWLAERYGTTARPLLQPPDDPQACLLALLEQADLVTEMRMVRHPFREQGVRAQPGIEY
jgi:hypothetical protein